MVLGLGITLCLAGFVTNIAISSLGLLLSLLAAVGWFRNVLPHEKHEDVPIQDATGVLVAAELTAARHKAKSHGAISPYNLFAGIEAGLAGGVAMAIPAILFGWINFHSPWYAINVLAANGLFGWTEASDAFLSQFHPQGLLTALVIHGMVSVLVGLLYGAILPIFPRMPLLTAGLIAPLLWTGPACLVLNNVSPNLSGRVDWRWFALSQIAFGLIAGLVVTLRFKMRSTEFQALSLNARAGLHTDHSDEDKR